MTLTQLEYIVAVAEYKNFTIAAEKTFVTQPTLSMQVAKFEEELKITVFDRATHPITITSIGQKVITQCKRIIAESKKIKSIVDEERGSVEGEIVIGIIPTVLSSLVPLFYRNFTKKFPNIKLKIKEMKTDDIIEGLKAGTLDFGIASTPLKDDSLKEHPLYHEPLVAYIPSNMPLYEAKQINTKDLEPENILLLEEGNCFRNNVINLCDPNPAKFKKIDMDSGSFLTLVKLVDEGLGMTLLPLMVAEYLNLKDSKSLKFFTDSPTREISLLCHETQIREKFMNEFVDFMKAIMRGKNFLDTSKITSPKIEVVEQ